MPRCSYFLSFLVTFFFKFPNHRAPILSCCLNPLHSSSQQQAHHSILIILANIIIQSLCFFLLPLPNPPRLDWYGLNKY